jgi:mRNA deadenylase 3'-5' endonuclease subunit Ccr4
LTFTLVTWNVLATAYIRPSFYPNTPSRCLDPAWRIPSLVRRARALGADVLCLQEVEVDTFEALQTGLAELHYAGVLAMKEGKPDGCALFVRSARFELVESLRIVYADGAGAPASGHVGQLAVLGVYERNEREGARLAVLNTHLKWDPPGTPPESQWGLRQAREILEVLRSEPAAGHAQIVCGDLNVRPESDVVATLRAAGFSDAHGGLAEIHTCNANREPKLIDHIFSRGALRAPPRSPPRIDAATPLPSDDEPSDHLPLEARFVFP